MRVLVATKDPVSRQSLKKTLESWDHDVVVAKDGAEAWQLLRRKDPPRLAILDELMPRMNGSEVCRQVRRQIAEPFVYTLLLREEGSHEHLCLALDSGADDYLIRPFDMEELRVRLSVALRLQYAHDGLGQLAKQLAAKNGKLAELTATAHRFVDDVSHEFRTPLSVIKEFTSIIADGLGGPVTEQQTEYLHIVSNAVHDLTRMVDDLLDSSKLKAGFLRVDRRPHHVSDIVKSVRPIIAAKAARKHIKQIENIDPDLEQVFADSEKVGRVILNLAVNAIKFSPKASQITVWAKTRESGDVEIGITDQGPGLSPQDKQIIFHRFKQVRELGGSGAQGLGLGLNVAKNLTWVNLGQIYVVSEPGQGSTFSFTLPTCEAQVILDRYRDRLAELDKAADEIAVVRISTTQPAYSLEQLRSFLAAICYASDLLLKARDGCSVVAIGLTCEPDRWITRLQCARAAAVKDSPAVPMPEFDIEHLGSWSYPKDINAAVSCALDQLLLGARACA